MSILHFIKRCAITASETTSSPAPVKVYDLQAFFGTNEENSIVIESISPNYQFVDHIAKLIENNEVSNLHFSDIVEDFLNEKCSVFS